MNIVKMILKMAKEEEKKIDALCDEIEVGKCTTDQLIKVNFRTGKARAFNQILKTIAENQ
jgi:hypothetical protein